MGNDKKYNGWVNYETWLMNLNLTNDESTYNEVLNIVKDNLEKEDYKQAEALKSWVEETFSVENQDIIRICDTWTYRDFQEIVWCEIVEALSTDLEEPKNHEKRKVKA